MTSINAVCLSDASSIIIYCFISLNVKAVGRHICLFVCWCVCLSAVGLWIYNKYHFISPDKSQHAGQRSHYWIRGHWSLVTGKRRGPSPGYCSPTHNTGAVLVKMSLTPSQGSLSSVGSNSYNCEASSQRILIEISSTWGHRVPACLPCIVQPDGGS